MRVLAAIAAVVTVAGCDLVNGGTTSVDIDAAAALSDGGVDGYPAPHTGIVPAIGSANTLDIACWNIENFPDTASTPAYVADLITSLDLDLVVVEEVANVDAWDELIARLPNHDAVLSSHRYTATSYQKIGLIYRTATVAVGTPELLFASDSYGFPRPLFKVPVVVGGLTFDVIGVHLKAGINPDDEARRTSALITIDGYLRAQVDGGGEGQVVILGDFNQNLDTTDGQTVFAPLLAADRYRVRDQAAIDSGAASYIPSGRVIDHLVTTAGFEPWAGDVAAQIPKLNQQFPGYLDVISDHLPVVWSIPMPVAP
jgi:endonuclease/exonuclease/phosphatase family metal-dependent hydrolase